MRERERNRDATKGVYRKGTLTQCGMISNGYGYGRSMMQKIRTERIVLLHPPLLFSETIIPFFMYFRKIKRQITHLNITTVPTIACRVLHKHTGGQEAKLMANLTYLRLETSECSENFYKHRFY